MGRAPSRNARTSQRRNCFFNLRYPFWHVHGLKLSDSEMTQLCRAAIWYSDHIEICGAKLHGIKALRECSEVTIRNCDILSPEFGWSTRGIRMEDSAAVSEYFMMRSENLVFRNVHLTGKYSFQYIKNAVFDHCVFDTKDAFWHGEQVTVRNSTIKGEYLAWYSDGLTLENCRIIGTQPLCYCKNLKLIRCEMIDTDLAFEKSQVDATITTPVDSIKNPSAGRILVPAVGEVTGDGRRCPRRSDSDAFQSENRVCVILEQEVRMEYRINRRTGDGLAPRDLAPAISARQRKARRWRPLPGLMKAASTILIWPHRVGRPSLILPRRWAMCAKTCCFRCILAADYASGSYGWSTDGETIRRALPGSWNT